MQTYNPIISSVLTIIYSHIVVHLVHLVNRFFDTEINFL